MQGAAFSTQSSCRLLRKPDLSSVQVADDLNPLRVLTLFSAITTEDCILLDVADRPEYLIMTHIPVPPVCIRPSVEMDSGAGSNEDDLTVRLRVCFSAYSYEYNKHYTAVAVLLCQTDNTLCAVASCQ